MKTNIVLSIAAVLLTVAFAAPAAAHERVHFKGAIQGTEIDTPQGGTTLSAIGNLPGIATELGEFSFTYQLKVNLADITAPGSALLIAANGDSISARVAGSLEPTDTPSVDSITEIDTITGGTGRFAGGGSPRRSF